MHRLFGNPQRIRSYPTGRRQGVGPYRNVCTQRAPSALERAAGGKRLSIHQEEFICFLASPITFPESRHRDQPQSRRPLRSCGKDIYWYGIIIAAGFLLAVFYMLSRAKDFGVTQDDVLDMILWAGPIGVVCARLYYCIFYWELYADDPISILYIWEGGLPSTAASSAARLRCLSSRSTRRSRPQSCSMWRAWASSSASLSGGWGNFHEPRGARRRYGYVPENGPSGRMRRCDVLPPDVPL